MTERDDTKVDTHTTLDSMTTKVNGNNLEVQNIETTATTAVEDFIDLEAQYVTSTMPTVEKCVICQQEKTLDDPADPAWIGGCGKHFFHPECFK